MSIKKNVAVFVGLTLAVAVAFGAVSPVSAAALTQAQIDAIIGLLQSFGADQSTISNVQASLTGGTPTGGTTGGYVFNANLTMGSKGADVMNLQKVLNSDANTQVAASGVGSAGNESSYFGALTKAAVIKFQNKYGITPAVGYVGAITRAKLNTMGGVVVVPPGTPPPVSVGTGLTVAAGTQPAVMLFPLSAARVPFTKVNFTAGSDGDVTINSLVVERGGPSVDADVSGIVLLDENGSQVGLAKTLNSAHQVTLSEPFTVKSGQTRTMTLAANRPAADADSSAAGAVFTLSLVAVNTSATVTGSLPIVGTAQTGNDGLTIGTVTNARGPLDPNGATTKNVGTTGYTFSSVKVTAGSQEDVRLNSVRWNQGSSSAASDLANLVTIVDGISYPTTISSDGKYYTSVFAGGLTIAKGNSREISIKGDIVGGSGRTVAFNLEKTTDVNLVGLLFGYGITPPTSGTGFDADSLWYSGSVVTINAGSITVSNDPSVSSQNVAIQLSGQPLAGFTVDVKGEAVSVAKIEFNLSTVGNEAQDITQVSIVDQNGSVLAGPVDGSGTTANGGLNALTFNDTITFPVGVTKIQLKGKLSTGFVDGDTIQASTTPSSDWTTATGATTGVTVTPSPSTSITGSTKTVKAAALTISVGSDPVSQTVVAGANAFTFAKFLLNANSSGEDMRMTSLLLDYSTDGTATNVKNCRLFDGSTQITTGTNIVDPSAAASSTTFTFDSGNNIAKGTTKTLELKCDIASGSTGKYQMGITAAQSATGLTSGQSVTPTLNSSGGPRMTLSAGGALTVTLDSASPAYRVVSAGSTGNTVSVLRFNATSEDIRINTIGLQLAGASSTPGDLVKATLWDGMTQIGEAIFDASIKDTSGNFTATSTLTSNFVVPKDGYKVVTVKVDTALQGVSQSGTPGNFLAIDYDATMRASTKGVGLSSGSTTDPNSASDSASNGIRVFRSIPTLALVDLPNNGRLTGARPDLMRFKITASPTGDIGIYRFTFRLSTSSGITINNLNVYAFEDSSFSTPISGVQTDGSLALNSLSTTGLTDANTKSQDYEIGAATAANASTTVVVPAGLTRYFVLRGDTSSLGSTYSVSSQLQGDADFNNIPIDTSVIINNATTTYLASTTGTDLYGNDDFIWRPFSTSTTQAAGASNAANDYADGYGVPGLPTTNTTAQTGTN
ncbi:MAG: peptidoglycan-binding protein [Patescibacteria group bacterium]